MESNDWVKCISVVTFDEDLGQRVEYQTPQTLTESHLQTLAYLAFPDSNSCNTIGDLFYVFKMRSDPTLFGYVYFRQRRDPSKPRKFFQKSLVLLSEHPYIALFRQVVEIIGPLYFDHGISTFEAVNSCMKIWPLNRPGTSLEIPMLGSIVYFTVPSKDTSCNPQLLSQGLTDILESVNLSTPGLFQDINLCEVFGVSFCQKFLWAFWQIIMSGEDLLLVTDNPGSCSLGVLALISLISPLIYSGDVYPYFTIYDTDFKTVQNNYEKKKNSDIVIGATNPYILKIFSETGNIFQCEDQGGLNVIFSKTPHTSSTSKIPGLFEGSTKEKYAINNTAIRQYFRDMTLSFLQPFQDYLSVNEEQINLSPYTASPLRPFIESEFISQLSACQTLPITKFTSKTKAISIYSKFIKSSTFVKWFAEQRQKASHEAEKMIRKASINFDIRKLFQLPNKERKTFYEKILMRLEYEEMLGEDLDGIDKLKLQINLLGPCNVP